jgi:hypothetical protein
LLGLIRATPSSEGCGEPGADEEHPRVGPEPVGEHRRSDLVSTDPVGGTRLAAWAQRHIEHVWVTRRMTGVLQIADPGGGR